MIRQVLAQMAKSGEPVAISFGKKTEKVAAIVPYHLLQPQSGRVLGLMKDRARCVIHEDAALSDGEVLEA